MINDDYIDPGCMGHAKRVIGHGAAINRDDQA